MQHLNSINWISSLHFFTPLKETVAERWHNRLVMRAFVWIPSTPVRPDKTAHTCNPSTPMVRWEVTPAILVLPWWNRRSHLQSKHSHGDMEGHTCNPSISMVRWEIEMESHSPAGCTRWQTKENPALNVVEGETWLPRWSCDPHMHPFIQTGTHRQGHSHREAYCKWLHLSHTALNFTVFVFDDQERQHGF